MTTLKSHQIGIITTLVLFFLALGVPLKSQAYSEVLNPNGDFEDGLDSWGCIEFGLDGSTEDCLESNHIFYDEDFEGYYAIAASEGSNWIYQHVTVPEDADRIKLSLFFQFYSEDISGVDWFSIEVYDTQTGEAFLYDIIDSSDGNLVDWSYYSDTFYNIAGRTLTVKFQVFNTTGSIKTFAAIDDVKIRAQTYAELNGVVFNENNNRVNNAHVKIKNYKGEIVWEGYTNKNGVFTADSLKGSLYKYRIIIYSGGYKYTYRFKIKWGKIYDQGFRMLRN